MLQCKHNFNERNEMNNTCPNNRDGLHKYTYGVGSGTKGDFEPMSYGGTAEETVYRRTEYAYMACPCGQVKKSKVVYEAAL